MSKIFLMLLLVTNSLCFCSTALFACEQADCEKFAKEIWFDSWNETKQKNVQSFVSQNLDKTFEQAEQQYSASGSSGSLGFDFGDLIPVGVSAGWGDYKQWKSSKTLREAFASSSINSFSSTDFYKLAKQNASEIALKAYIECKNGDKDFPFKLSVSGDLSKRFQISIGYRKPNGLYPNSVTVTSVRGLYASPLASTPSVASFFQTLTGKKEIKADSTETWDFNRINQSAGEVFFSIANYGELRVPLPQAGRFNTVAASSKSPQSLQINVEKGKHYDIKVSGRWECHDTNNPMTTADGRARDPGSPIPQFHAIAADVCALLMKVGDTGQLFRVGSAGLSNWTAPADGDLYGVMNDGLDDGKGHDGYANNVGKMDITVVRLD